MESLFYKRSIIQDENSFKKAGFIIFRSQKYSFVKVARHPSLKGWVLKLYLLSENRCRSSNTMTGQDWLIRRCVGAAKIREFIQQNHIHYFAVPDKWLFELPKDPLFPEKRVFVVVETDMHVYSKAESREKWKTKCTTQHLDELFLLVKNGYGSPALPLNVPYTKMDKFAFIDTEFFNRTLNIPRLRMFFSPKMSHYWSRLISNVSKQYHLSKDAITSTAL